MDNSGAGPAVQAGDDLSALAWVHGELRRSLETAHRALRRYLKEAHAASGSDVDAVDPSVLRMARTQLHQGVGALELVGLPAVADVLRASEAAVQRMVTRPALVDTAAVDAVERVSFALLDFLGRQLAGKSVSPVMLFPQYRAAQQLAGADRIHPADLWKVEWQWRELPPDRTATPRNADDEVRTAMEMLVLSLMRQPPGDAGRAALAEMSELCADVGAGARLTSAAAPHLATLWQLAAAVFEAQAAGLLVADNYTKRIASRLLAQLRSRAAGAAEPSDRLAQDLLFFCSHARAPTPEQPAPRLAAVRKAWKLDELPTADYETPRLGRFDPALLVLARKRVAAAKDSWSAVAGGELHRLAGLTEQFVLVAESLQRLLPGGDVLAQSLQAAGAQTVAAGSAPPPALAMEVATAILYLDASLEDGEFDHPELAERVQHLARRIDDVRVGAEPQQLDVWMEELYRRVSDRQTMGSVVQELRASLSEIEKQIDQYFRDPTQRQLLIPVPAQLSAMRGVLSVLGLDQASAAALHMRDDVDALAQTEVDPQRAVQTGTFDRLADNLGALSFLIDMLSVQPALAKSLFRFDPETGSLSAVMGQSVRISAFAAFDEAPAPAPSAGAVPLLEELRSLAESAAQQDVGDEELARRIEPVARLAAAAEQSELSALLVGADAALRGSADAGARARVRSDLIQALATLAPAPAAAAAAERPAEAAPSGLEDDAEMREIFIEESREVIANARAALERLADAPDNATDLTAVRRAFHTLKGSSRMVGLPEFGEAGWACEQLYNARLAQAPRMDHALRQFTGEALTYLAEWTDAIESGQDLGHNAADLAHAADALRLEGQRLAIALPERAAPDAAQAAVELEGPAEAPAPLAPVAEPVADFHSATEVIEAPLPVLEPWVDIETPTVVLTATDTEATLVLPGAGAARDQPAGVDLDLDFAAGAAPEDAAASAPASLTERVPELPSAADLDLGPPAMPPVPAAAPEPAFDLDLNDFGAAAPPAGTALPDLPLDAPPPEPAFSGVPQGEALEIDLEDLGFALPPLRSEAPAPQAELRPASEQVDGEAMSPADAAVEPPAEPATAAAPTFAASTDLPMPTESAAAEAAEDEQVKVVGPLRISIPLFNIYLNEADELSRRLVTELAEWGLESDRHPVPETSVALAHSLAGNSATVGYGDLSALARALEHALMRSHDAGRGRSGEPALFADAAEEIRRLLHQFAAGFLRPVAAGLMDRLAAHERWPLAAAEDTPAAAAAVAGEPLPVPLEPAAGPSGLPAVELPAAAEPVPDDTGLVDSIDAELLPIFEEEAEELLPQLQSRLRDWLDRPAEPDAPMACMRTLHTVKGGARLAGAMRLGELAHRLETAIEGLVARGDPQPWDIEPLMADADAMSAAFEALRRAAAPAAPEPARPLPLIEVHEPHPAPEPAPEPEPVPLLHLEFEPEPEPEVAPPVGEGAGAGLVLDFEDSAVSQPDAAPAPVAVVVPAVPDAAAAPQPSSLELAAQTAADVPPVPAEAAPELPSPAAAAPAVEVVPPPDAVPRESRPPAAAPVSAGPPPEIDWRRFALGGEVAAASPDRLTGTGAVVRVRSGLLDRMVNQAGEVSITRARIDSDVKQLQGSLSDLTDSLERMRRQLRDIELQAETQISSRIEAAKAASQSFDPLEMDRFTRFQELTRFMAESVNDVATLQRSLQRTLQSTEDELAAQARLTRELQDDLLRTRMVEFESIAERLHRTVRQAARETGKQARLEIVGGAIEIDRSVLERMAGSFEHLLRNSVAHGIESPDARRDAGKDASGLVTVTVAQAGNEVAVEFADDGGGLDLQRIRARAVERALLVPEADVSDHDLSQLIFRPGFSTAEAVTELAGRGVGLDVVRAEVNAMGGRIETQTEAGRGTRFKLLMPLTTAVTQVVMLRCGELTVAVPSTLIELVRRVPSAEVNRAYSGMTLDYAGEAVRFFWLGALLRAGTRGEVVGRTQTVVIVRSAGQRVALHVDEVAGNQEVVVKNVGPQLARLPGLAGVTLLPSGAVALIYNPVALATLYGDEASARMQQAASAADAPAALQPAEAGSRAAMVMVVDDSLTVRRVTQRLLVREGYRVVTAKDGLEALERLAVERPVVLLSDIEMPRMDGFDLVRNLRSDPQLAGLPVVMITSRIAQKHRDYAAELGVDHYLGKPYSEEELLTLVARYAGADVIA